MAKAPVWATLGRLEKRQRNRNIKNSRFYEKKLEKKSGGKIPEKIGEKIWVYQKKKLENFRFDKNWKKCGGTKNKIGDKSAIPKKMQILNISNIVDKKVQILNVSNIVHKNIAHQILYTRILSPIFGEVWKFWVYTQM